MLKKEEQIAYLEYSLLITKIHHYVSLILTLQFSEYQSRQARIILFMKPFGLPETLRRAISSKTMPRFSEPSFILQLFF